MYTPSKNKKTLSVFGLVMINVIAIDSLRNLPSNAATGLYVVFYYLLAGLIFLIPCLLLTAELATNHEDNGGAYLWVRNAFGEKYGFMTIWVQWIYNVIWYPTILSFIAVNIAYLFDPSLATNKEYMLTVVITMFTLSTLLNSLGLSVSSLISSISAIVGTLIPMAAIIILGALWIFDGKPLAIVPSVHTLIPAHFNIDNIAFIVVVFFSLMGFEMSAVHAGDVKNPKRDFPRALGYSSLIVLITMTLASVAIALIVPQSKLNIVSGLDQAFVQFLGAFHAAWLMKLLVLFMIIGGFGGMSAWVLGPSKGLMIAAQDNCAPKFFGIENKRGAPSNMLWAQWGIVLALSVLFLFFKSFSEWYWILSDLTAQIALVFYILVFAAAIRLRYSQPRKEGAFRIPGGNIGIWVVGLIGIAACLFGIGAGLIPPSNIHITHIVGYEATLIGGALFFSLIPLWIYKFNRT